MERVYLTREFSRKPIGEFKVWEVKGIGPSRARISLSFVRKIPSNWPILLKMNFKSFVLFFLFI